MDLALKSTAENRHEDALHRGIDKRYRDDVAQKLDALGDEERKAICNGPSSKDTKSKNDGGDGKLEQLIMEAEEARKTLTTGSPGQAEKEALKEKIKENLETVDNAVEKCGKAYAETQLLELNKVFLDRCAYLSVAPLLPAQEDLVNRIGDLNVVTEQRLEFELHQKEASEKAMNRY